MAEIGLLLGWLCCRFSSVGSCLGQTRVRQVGLPILGCAVALTAGCGLTGHSQAPVKQSTSVDMASLRAQAQLPEQKPPKWELEIPDRPEIDAWVRRFSEEKHRSFQTQLDRARYYVVPVQEIFQQRGLPKDVIFVALVESGFSPTARSHASAVGMWQFISSTGKRFGLEQNEWIDERRHPLKAAQAAADYLSLLYDMFESWPLALAAYNAGENGVRGALGRSGLTTFWELAEGGHLPSETCDYVPKVLATVKIIREPQRYGFHFDPKLYVKKHDTVPVPGGVKLAVIEKKTGVPLPSLKECNPELCKPVVPPGCESYELCVPAGMRELVLGAINQGELKEEKPPAKEPVAKEPAVKPKEVASTKKSSTLSYKVNPGDTWFGLSRKYGCTPQTLAFLNGSASSQPLKAGQELKVPSAEPTKAVETIKKNAKESKSAEPSPSAAKKVGAVKQKPAASAPVRSSVRQGDIPPLLIVPKSNVAVVTIASKSEPKPAQKLTSGKSPATGGSVKEPTTRSKK